MIVPQQHHARPPLTTTRQMLQMCPMCCKCALCVANVPVANVPYCCKYALLLQMCQLPTIPKVFKILENILNFAEKLPEMLFGRVSNVPTKFFVFLQFGVGARVYFVLFRGFIHVAMSHFSDIWRHFSDMRYLCAFVLAGYLP